MMTARILRNLAVAGLVAAASAAHAVKVDTPGSAWECASGGCPDGTGVGRNAVTGWQLAGPWRSGQTVPGETYTVTLPGGPAGRSWSVKMGADGLFESGELPLTAVLLGPTLPVWKGRFATVEHRFSRRREAVFRSGTYDTGIGIEYRGRFEYLPAKAGSNGYVSCGFYIFYGDEVDTEEDTRKTGLRVSDIVCGDGARPTFVPANPAYLAQLQKRYQKDLDERAVEIKDEEARSRWTTVFSMIGKVAMLATGVNAREVILGIVSDALDGADLRSSAQKAIGAHVTDPEEEKRLSEAVQATT